MEQHQPTALTTEHIRSGQSPCATGYLCAVPTEHFSPNKAISWHGISFSFQVEHLLASAGPRLHVITVDVHQVASPSWSSLGPAVVASSAAEADRALAAGVDTLIMTSRKLVTVDGELLGCARGRERCHDPY